MNSFENNDFLGRGWSFPPTFNKSSKTVDLVEGEADIKRSLEVLLTTHIGERILHPDYGSNLFQSQFETMGSSLQTDLTEIIQSAVARYETRVEIEEVKLDVVANDGKAAIHLIYRIVQTNTYENLVFPFYLNKS